MKDFRTAYKKHHKADLTKSFHYNMAITLKNMLADKTIDSKIHDQAFNAINIHINIENSKTFNGIKIFTKFFGRKK